MNNLSTSAPLNSFSHLNLTFPVTTNSLGFFLITARALLPAMVEILALITQVHVLVCIDHLLIIGITNNSIT